MSSVVADVPVIDLAEDLEDGEIDDEEDEEEAHLQAQQAMKPQQQTLQLASPAEEDVQFVGVVEVKNKVAVANEDVFVVGLPPPGSDSGGQQQHQHNHNSSSGGGGKSKKPRPLEDDHASSIENAIANALKKKGIEPPMPRMRSLNQDMGDGGHTEGLGMAMGQGSSEPTTGGVLQPSRNSRRRKRKKTREREQKKDKDNSQKRARRAEEDETSGTAAAADVSDDDMDEYEMMNVRGGSPPPAGAAAPPSAQASQRFGGPDWDIMGDGPSGGGAGGGYDSQQDPYSSYDSYSEDEAAAAGGGLNSQQRRRMRRDKEQRNNRKRRDRDRNDTGMGGAKRNRRDSADGGGNGGGGGMDKMSGRIDPRKLELCKFYLMDCCAKREKCSYMHKEFPCKYYYLGMDCYAGDDCLFHHGEPLSEQLRNVLLKHMETAPKEILGDFKRKSRDVALGQMTRRHEQLCEQFKKENTWSTVVSGGMGRRQDQHQQQHQMQQQQQQQQQQHQQQQQQAQMQVAEEKKRKSRWEGKTTAKATGGGAESDNASLAAAEPSKPSLPAHLELANLSHVLSPEHMAKLNKLGISNLEQMMQVPFGQLKEVGLTLVEIGEIQRMAEEAKPPTQPEQADSNHPAKAAETETNSNSNSNGFIMVDYTQYLKDAHVSFSTNDPLDDDRDDDEQLVIDDGNESAADEEEQKASSPSKPVSAGRQNSASEEAPLPSVFDLPSFMSNMLGKGSSATQVLPASATSPSQEMSPSVQAGGDLAGLRPVPGGSNSSNVFSRLLFGDRQPDAEARAAFYRDIIRNPFKAHSGDGESSNENSNHSNSRSVTPTPTPEPGSQSPKQEDAETSQQPRATSSLYTRSSMYDFDPSRAEKLPLGRNSRLGEDEDNSQSQDRDIDMRLPFEPMKHYMPATEIDAAIFSHTPLRWQLVEVAVELPDYRQQRTNARHKEQRDLRDPRVRRILGLPELPDMVGSLGSSATSTASSTQSGAGDSFGRAAAAGIASPESETSARDATPVSPPPVLSILPPMNTPPPLITIPPPNVKMEKPAARADPRRDPRRAHLQAQAQAQAQAQTPAQSQTRATNVSGGSKQISEIRNIMQSSPWYKDLGSNNKIMVNQQLALVFTELKKYHQLPEDAPKIFDVSFIVNNATLQQIFAKLFIFVDDNGQVVQLPEESSNSGGSRSGMGVGAGTGAGAGGGVVLPNMSQPPPNLAQMLRQPPPNVMQMSGMMMQMGNYIPPFNQPPPCLMPGAGGGGGPPVGVPNGNPFNPFANNNNNGGGGNGNGNGGGGNGNGGGMGNMNSMGNMGVGMPFNNGMPFKNFNNGNGNNGGGGGGRHFAGGNNGGNKRNHRGGNQRNRNNI
ncbi:protein suppressor of sable isoform X2 [Drosophila kikkawai]|uniref:Protein suppressor of sable isoform X2 n=1 Tax=Drosophila kikkawai TaxID=30033 RepID=A0ABM4GPG4_DROKI